MQPEAANVEWKPRFNPWLIAVVVAMAAFMEVLDTSIANVALPHISGNLGASMNQGTWVLTTYLVSNAIVLPITGWFTSVLGRKRFFLICIALFTTASFLCGIAPSFGFLLVARAIQGAGGGGMQPMAQAIMVDSFPHRLRGLAFAIFGITVIVAPALGPTFGGWITDNYSWRWIFLINLPVGAIALSLISQLVEDPPFLRRVKAGQLRLDTMGLSMLVLGVGALQIMLDKGQEDDWFSSQFILVLAIVTVVCLSFLVLWEWDDKGPVVDVRLFKRFNFSSSCAMMFFAGIISFTSGVIMPQFLQVFMGYTAQKAGLVVSAGAAVMLVTMPMAGVLTAFIPAKYLMAFGWLGSAIAMFWSTRVMSMQISIGTASQMMAIQFAPIAFIFVPAITASYIGVPQDHSDSVSGLSNFMRNIGSSVGTSMIFTVVARRSQFHLTRMVDHTALGNTDFINQIQGLTYALHTQSAGVGMADAQTGALTEIYQLVAAQAATLSYIDAYYLMGAASVVMLFLSFFLKTNDPKHTEQHAAH
ncbi:MAG: DHA2 family efflux MFS transporter permease subunit [Terracidiphilus sp.]